LIATCGLLGAGHVGAVQHVGIGLLGAFAGGQFLVAVEVAFIERVGGFRALLRS
jgi:hypothetical protein